MTENTVIFSFSKIKNVENDGRGMMKHKIKIIKFKKMDDGKNREIIISTIIQGHPTAIFGKISVRKTI